MLCFYPFGQPEGGIAIVYNRQSTNKYKGQQEVIKNQSEALKKGNAQADDNATCADAVG
jgi:hypothetical protein